MAKCLSSISSCGMRSAPCQDPTLKPSSLVITRGVGGQVIRFGVQDLLQPITVKIPHDWIPQTSDSYEKVEVEYGVKDHASNALKRGPRHQVPVDRLSQDTLDTTSFYSTEDT